MGDLRKQKKWTRRIRRLKGPPRKGRIDLAKHVQQVMERLVPEEARRLTLIKMRWQEIAPKWVATNTWPVVLRGSRLVLHVQDNQWLHELNYWRQELISRINASLPHAKVHCIDAFLGPVPALDQRGDTVFVDEAPVVVEKDLIFLSEIPPSETMEALNAVHDRDLRDMLAGARMHMGQSFLARKHRQEEHASTSSSAQPPAQTKKASEPS